MSASNTRIKKIHKEVKYLEKKEKIKQLLKSFGHENILRYMIEELDMIEDIDNTQSINLFKLISSLEESLMIYPRIKNSI